MSTQYIILIVVIIGAVLVFFAIIKYGKLKAGLKAPFIELFIEGEKKQSDSTKKRRTK